MLVLDVIVIPVQVHVTVNSIQGRHRLLDVVANGVYVLIGLLGINVLELIL